MRYILRALSLSDEESERLLVLNLRGVSLSLTTPAGRSWLVDHLRAHEAEVIVMDTYGPASAPSLDSENDNAGGRRFLTAFDALKDEAGVKSSVWASHTGRGRHEPGEEHARGATVIDDWADVRLILTKDAKRR